MSKTHEAKLMEAARLIGEVSEALDRSGNVCDSCGLTVQVNRVEYLRSIELDAMVRKLERFCGIGDVRRRG
jgi:hypothetical protein